jgi:hypothetical protein
LRSTDPTRSGVPVPFDPGYRAMPPQLPTKARGALVQIIRHPSPVAEHAAQATEL